MTFGNNSLTLRYRPGPPPQHAQVAGQSSVVAQEQPSETSSVTLAWNALDALAEVAVGEGWEERVGGGVQVAMAEKWSKGRCVGFAFRTKPKETQSSDS
jgi:type 2A phosphatase activator TIP41